MAILCFPRRRRFVHLAAVLGITVGLVTVPLSASAGVNDQFVYPVSGSTPVEDVAWHQNHENGTRAIDIAASSGAEVAAAQSGVVSTTFTGCANSGSTGCGHGYGNHVVIRHDRPGVDSPLYTLYGHLNSIQSVGTGQHVTTGQKLGVVAMSGTTTGPHTHFAIGVCADQWWVASCTIWNGPDTTATAVNRGSLIPGVYPQLNGTLPDAPWQWHLRDANSDGGASISYSFGVVSSDHPLTGDWDGSESSTPGLVRGFNGQWHWHLRNENSNGGAFVSLSYGLATDTAIVGDWDGNGTYTPGIVRNSGGVWEWHLKNTLDSGGAFTSFPFGSALTDTPIVGDWDGDGTMTPGIVRSVGGELQWHLRNENSGGGAFIAFNFGSEGIDHPIAGDWDANGTFTPGIVRNSGGVWQWHLRNENSTGGAFTSFSFGATITDMPIVGDWNGDGMFSPGIVRAG